jgi:AcrR family transcriptional regulator
MSRSSTLTGSAPISAGDRVLDAAYEQFSLVGIQRSSMEDVARRAGVSRVTVYRHFANKDALVQQVLHREFERYVRRYLEDLEQAETAVDRILGGYVSTLQGIRRNPLLRGLLSVELDALVSSMAGRTDQVLAMARMFIASQLHAEQAAGEIADHIDVDVVADLMTRVAISYVLIPSDVIDLDDDEQTLAMARSFLLPMLGWA